MTAAEAPPRAALRAPPALSGGLPLLGHALELQRDPVGLLTRGVRAHGETFSFRLPGRRVTALLGPRGSAAFFRAPDEALSAREAYRFTVPIFGDGIVYDSPPRRMREQLDLVLPALTPRRFQAYALGMQSELEAFTNGLGASGSFELCEAMNQLTIYIASRCLVGPEFRTGVSAEFSGLYHDLEGGINLLAFMVPRLPLPSFRRRDRARARVVEIISGIIRERRRTGAPGEDFLATLMEARYTDGSALSEDNIAGLLLALIFAGQHTSAVLLDWTLALLLQSPEWLARVRAEVDATFPPGAPIDVERLRGLHDLERAVQEAERLHPPLIMLMRMLREEFEHEGTLSRPGDLVLVSPAVSHRLPSVFKDPDRYDPDRFGPGREEGKPPFAMIAFGGGRHRCLGTTFAYLQVKVLTCLLLRELDLELATRAPRPDYSTFVVGPERPCTVRFRRRTGRAR